MSQCKTRFSSLIRASGHITALLKSVAGWNSMLSKNSMYRGSFSWKAPYTALYRAVYFQLDQPINEESVGTSDWDQNQASLITNMSHQKNLQSIVHFGQDTDLQPFMGLYICMATRPTHFLNEELLRTSPRDRDRPSYQPIRHSEKPAKYCTFWWICESETALSYLLDYHQMVEDPSLYYLWKIPHSLSSYFENSPHSLQYYTFWMCDSILIQSSATSAESYFLSVFYWLLLESHYNASEALVCLLWMAFELKTFYLLCILAVEAPHPTDRLHH